MTEDKFISLVREMRTAQIDYFRTRDKDCLILSKRLEAKVDAALKENKITKFLTENTEQNIRDAVAWMVALGKDDGVYFMKGWVTGMLSGLHNELKDGNFTDSYGHEEYKQWLKAKFNDFIERKLE